MLKRTLSAAILFLSAAAWAQAPGTAITVYNDNQALVRQVRKLDLAAGVSPLKYTDVAQHLDPTSVHIRSLTEPDKVSVQEQNFEYDLVSTDQLLKKYIDQKIRVEMPENKLYEGTLLAADGANLVLGAPEGKIQSLAAANVRHVEFPSLPAGLITRPTLVWLVDNRGKKEQLMETSYLTGEINWHAEYVAVVDQNDQALELSSWVSIENNSGATYQDAQIKLMAGDVHRVQPEMKAHPMMLQAARADYGGGAQFEEKSFFEYHLYTLQHPATLKDRQIKQIALFPSRTVAAKKILVFDGQRDARKVDVTMTFKNSQAEGMGLPLPKGKVRLYKRDGQSVEFIGEDMLDHTPKDETVKLMVGKAFDVTGERALKDTRRISDRKQEEVIEIKLKNHKDKSVDVVVVEHLNGREWSIKDNTLKFVKKDASTIEFTVPVPANGEAVAGYTVRWEW